MKERKVLLLVMLWMIVPKLSFADCGNIIAIQIGKPGPGYESTPNPDEQPDPGLPDFIVKKVILTDTGGNERYEFFKNEEVKMKATLKNIGDDDIGGDENIQTRYYLSKGYKEDSHSEWIRVGKDNTKGRNLDPGETHREEEGLKLWEYDEIQPSKIYNIVVCVDRIKDSHNKPGDYEEKHESNNCSTEAVFKIIIPNQPPEGWLDSTNCDQFTGWTRDPNTTPPIGVHFYTDGEAGIGTFVGNTTANEYRSDLPFDDKSHGFTFTTPESLKDGNQHSIYAYGIDDQGGTNPLLSGSPLLISGCYPPEPEPTPEPENNYQHSNNSTNTIRADVNNDGILDDKDVSLIMDVSVGYDRTDQGWINTPTTGDVNCNGTVSTADAMLTSRKISGQDMTPVSWCDKNFPEIRADVNQDGQLSTADAMLINFKINGNDMSPTSWVNSPSTGDVNCDLEVNSHDVDLALQKSVGNDMSETDWCGGE